MKKDYYHISLYAFVLASAIHLGLLAFLQLAPLDIKNTATVAQPCSAAILLIGCLVSTIYGLLALKSTYRPLIWVIPSVLFLLTVALDILALLRSSSH